MTFDDIEVTPGDRVVASDADVRAAEALLGHHFPTGYRRYVTTLGKGVLGGTFLRVWLPGRIAGDLDGWRERISTCWFWDGSPEILSQDQAKECTIVGDSLHGDEFIVHPSDPDRILVLPRYSSQVFVAGRGLLDAAEWAFSSGELTEPFVERQFESDAG